MSRGATLVVGASGLVGHRVLSAFRSAGTAVGTYCTQPAAGLRHLDLTDRAQVIAVVRELRPSVIVCAGAVPSVELCQQEPDRTRRVNVGGTLHLARAAHSVGATFVHFSSEYVFDGASGPYREEDPTRPINEYGRQKVQCEETIRRTLSRYLIVRTSGVYDREPASKNFVMQLLDRLTRGERMLVPNDQVITPTYATNLAQALKELVEIGALGTFHVAGATPMNRAEFAYIITEIFKLDASLIVPVPTARLGLAAPRPTSAGLSVRKVAALIRTPLLSSRDGLLTMREASANDPRASNKP